MLKIPPTDTRTREDCRYPSEAHWRDAVDGTARRGTPMGADASHLGRV